MSKLGYPVTTDAAPEDVDVAELDAVIIPGGHSPEGMRKSPAMIDLVRKANEQGLLVAAICHAGWVLASSGVAKGRDLTCVSVIRDDVINAGGNYLNEAVVRDGNLITSRLPSDLPDFVAAIVEALRERSSTRKAGATANLPETANSTAGYRDSARYVPVPVGTASPNYTQVAAVEVAS
jgi:protease I